MATSRSGSRKRVLRRIGAPKRKRTKGSELVEVFRKIERVLAPLSAWERLAILASVKDLLEENK